MKTRQTTLIDGSQLIFIPIPHSTSTTIMALIKAGPAFDPKHKTGLSHFTEHMLARGSKKWPTKLETEIYLEEKGISYYAFSYHETNKYWMNAPNQNTTHAIKSLLDRIHQPIFRKKDFVEEKGVILNELNILNSNPEKLIWEQFSQAMWSKSALGRPYIGTQTAIENISINDVKQFWQEYYTPNRIVYLVAGGVDYNTVVETFNEELINSPSIKKQHNSKSIKKYGKPSHVLLNKNITTTYTALGFQTVPFNDKEKWTLELIGTYLAGGLSSTLHRQLIYPGLSYSVFYSSEYLENTGYFALFFTTNNNNLEKVLEKIIQELRSLRKIKHIKYFDFAKGILKGDILVDIETNYDWANWYAYQLLYSKNNLTSPQHIAQEIDAITYADVKTIIEKYLTTSDIAIAIIGKGIKLVTNLTTNN